MTEQSEKYDWVPFYMELADTLLKYKTKREKLCTIISGIFDDLNIKPTIKIEKPDIICPFTVFASFNCDIDESLRFEIMKKLKEWKMLINILSWH